MRHDPSGTGIEYRRNPEWYVTGQPYLDGIIKYSIPEYGTQQSQFESGALWAMEPTATTRQDEVLRVKKDHPTMVLRQKSTSYWSLPHHVHWVLSQREDSPFKDQRLRQAVSMLYDREAYDEALYNALPFRRPVSVRDGQRHASRDPGVLPGSTRATRPSATPVSTSSTTSRRRRN